MRQLGEIAAEDEAAGFEGLVHLGEEQSSEEARQHRTGRKKPIRQLIQRLPSSEGPPPDTTQ